MGIYRKKKISLQDAVYLLSTCMLVIYGQSSLNPRFAELCVGLGKLGLFFLLVLIFSELGVRQTGVKGFKITIKDTYFVSIVFWMCVVGGVYAVFFPEHYTFSSVLIDLSVIVVFLAGKAVGEICNKHLFFKSLFFWGILGVVFGAIAISISDFNVFVTGDRTLNTWKPQYILWRFLNIWPILLVYCFVYKRKAAKIEKVISVFCAVFHMVLSFLFLKRVVFLEVTAIIVVFTLLNLKRKKIIKREMKILLLGVLAVLLLLIMSPGIRSMFQAMLGRFVNLDLSSFDRFVEYKDALERYSPISIITGTGIGSLTGGYRPTSMHIEWLNILYKGGLPFLVWMIYLFVRSFRVILSAKSKWYRFTSASLMYCLIVAVVVSWWDTTFISLLYSGFLFSILNYSHQKDVDILEEENKQFEV